MSRLLKNSFSRREKHKYECNQACYITKDLNNILSSQNHLLTKKSQVHRSKTHTHTLNKSNRFYISKNKLRQFSEHTLKHVFLVMAKSHCTCTCIKSGKEFVCCVWKTLQDCISVFMLWQFEIWENHFNSHTIITVWWGLSDRPKTNWPIVMN